MNTYQQASNVLAQLAPLYTQLAEAYRASDQKTIEQTRQQIETLELAYEEIKRTK